MQLPEAFDQFHEKISLGAKAHGKIQSASNGLIKFLSREYELSPGGVFLQGSYPNGTAVEPEDPDQGEYDADLVSFSAAKGMSPDDALDDLIEVLCRDSTYETLIRKEGSKKDPCVRLRYADDEVGGFHVDLVPARASSSGDLQAALEVPRRGEGWHDSSPTEYTDWCHQRGERFARTVKMLKRWREVHQPARQSIRSIVLQVLASNSLGAENSDAEALVSTLVGMQMVLDTSDGAVPVVSNPVLRAENLAARWEPSAYENFRRELDEAVDLAQRALNATDMEESHKLWCELLGSSFPAAPTQPAQPSGGVPPIPPPGHQRVQVPSRGQQRYGSR